MNIIQRNIERLIYNDRSNDEHIEPMTAWKWTRLYKIAQQHGLGPWVAEGIQAYKDDFYLQLSPTLLQQFLDLAGEKNPEMLKRYELFVERSKGLLHKLKRQSIEAYTHDFINTIKNIEE